MKKTIVLALILLPVISLSAQSTGVEAASPIAGLLAWYGEIVWYMPVTICTVVFALGNLAAYTCSEKARPHKWLILLQGALTGASLGAIIHFSSFVPVVGKILQEILINYNSGEVVVGLVGTLLGVFDHGWVGIRKGAKLFLGNFYVDERHFIKGIFQGVSRHTWEMPQSLIGMAYSQWRNAFCGVTRIDFIGGITYITTEGARHYMGVTLGSCINIWVPFKIKKYFENYIVNDTLLMHEFGHTVQSRRWGPFYLFVIGIPSVISQLFELWGWFRHRHDDLYAERWANRNTKRYFTQNYDVDWRGKDLKV